MTTNCLGCNKTIKTFAAWVRKGMSKYCSSDCKRRVRHPNTAGSWRQRATRGFPELGPCAKCNGKAVDRHHKNGDVTDNSPENIAMLCRRCHMETDGRLLRFVAAGGGRLINPLPPSPCSECGRLYKPLRRGLCARGYDRKYRAFRWKSGGALAKV
jgi:hypothetical protein